jgi:anti-sigma regulatory factor (Ser/Thr protein kinase)
MKKPLDEVIELETHVSANEKGVGEIIDFVSFHARDMAFEEKRVAQIHLALEEALGNIVRFACPVGNEQIKVTCSAHEMGALIVDIVDTGVPFNMLVVSTFPETAGDFSDPASIPSTKAMKRHIKNIEYRRDGENKTNILAWVVWPT